MLERAAPTRREALAIGLLAAGLAAVLLGRWVWMRAAGPPVTFEQEPSPGLVLDVNRAAWWELDALPGVGETLARRIVSHREAHGPFAAVDDLARIPGISHGLVSRWRPFLTIKPHGGPAGR